MTEPIVIILLIGLCLYLALSKPIHVKYSVKVGSQAMDILNKNNIRMSVKDNRVFIFGQDDKKEEN